TGDLHRRAASGGGAVAQLTIGVQSPAVAHAPGGGGTPVAVAHPELLVTPAAGQLDRRVGALRGAVPQLTQVVEPPAEDSIGGGETAGEVGAFAHLEELHAGRSG